MARRSSRFNSSGLTLDDAVGGRTQAVFGIRPSGRARATGERRAERRAERAESRDAQSPFTTIETKGVDTATIVYS